MFFQPKTAFFREYLQHMKKNVENAKKLLTTVFGFVILYGHSQEWLCKMIFEN